MRHYDPGKPYEVEVRCALKREFWTNRSEAIDFYLEGALCCEGYEARCYMDIVGQLMAGYQVASDGLEPKDGWEE